MPSWCEALGLGVLREVGMVAIPGGVGCDGPLQCVTAQHGGDVGAGVAAGLGLEPDRGVVRERQGHTPGHTLERIEESQENATGSGAGHRPLDQLGEYRTQLRAVGFDRHREQRRLGQTGSDVDLEEVRHSVGIHHRIGSGHVAQPE